MKLVIDIDDKVYGLLKYFENGFGFDDKDDNDDVKTALMRAVLNGTLLDTHDEEIIAETVKSIWGKPPYTELLDKIRAEIIQVANQEKLHDEKWALGLRHAVKIIDKHMAERSE